ncbi:MAG: hypothetical protein EOP61_10865 [Sphingomonadales bacterium]|nr:MAG: hypothetical protein EOP61_10865 [Sphingomonadales bacterium]
MSFPAVASAASARAQAMVRDIAGVDLARAEAALATAGNDIKLAVLLARGIDPAEARALLDDNQSILREALAGL